MKKMKWVAIILVIALLLVFPVNADEDIHLADMSEAECIEFIKQQNISIPNDYNDEEIWGPFIKHIIKLVENDPYYEFNFNYSVTQEFANQIKSAVNAYYEIENTATYLSLDNNYTTNSIINLQYSTPICEWNESFRYYNCYIFALGVPENVYKDPGYFSGTAFSLMYDVEGIAQLVKNDLQNKMHQNVRISKEISLDNLCTNEKVICLRKSTYDYHFMKFDSGEWLHKPGQSAILKYLLAQDAENPWTNEGLFETGIIPGDTYYNSDTYYISYDGHDWNYYSNNNGTHLKQCGICNDTFIYNCFMDYSSDGTFHDGYCSLCGYAEPNQMCTFDYQYDGQGNHTKVCTICDYSIQEVCNIESPYIGEGLHNAYCTECDYGINGLYCSYDYTPRGNGTHLKTCTLSDHYTGSEICTYQYTANGDGTHTATCRFCNATYIFNCEMIYEYQLYEQHLGECIICGYTEVGSCTPETTYTGNGSTNHIHQDACADCGNLMSDAQAACTFTYIFAGTVDGTNCHDCVCTECGYRKQENISCFYKTSDYCMFCGVHRDTVQVASLEELYTIE